MKTEQITGVAIVYNGKTWSLPKPSRHHDVIRLIGGINGPDIQGFITSTGRFLNRREAYLLARENGQLKRDPDPLKYQGDELFSEDLW